MNSRFRSWSGFVAAVAGFGTLCASAVAQSNKHDLREDRREERRDHRPPPAPPDAIAPRPALPPADPKLSLHLQQLEEQREKERRNKIHDEKAWEASRTQRAAAHRNELASTWGGLVNRPDAQAELNAHADRMARLNRILDVATQKGDTALAARCKNDIQREIKRNARAMQKIRTTAGV